MYAKPDNKDTFINELDTLYNHLQLNAPNNTFIIAGDLNARRKAWGDRTDNQRGKLLYQWVTEPSSHLKTKITPDAPIFKSAQSFLDIFLIASRLTPLNYPPDKATTLPCDSDHSALSLILLINNPNLPPWTEHATKLPANYKATKWSKFTKTLDTNYQDQIPNIHNLTIQDIDAHLLIITKAITTTVDQTVPKFKPKDSIQKYLNRKIIKLQKYKTLVSTLHNLRRHDPHLLLPISKLIKTYIKTTIKTSHSQLKTENYWTNMTKKIDCRKPESFFPRINRMFRPRQLATIKSLHIPNSQTHILTRSGCDLTKATTSNNEYTFTTPQDRLNIIGAYFEHKNKPKTLNKNSPLKHIIDITAGKIKADFLTNRNSGSTLSQFTENNPAHNPIQSSNEELIYCTSYLHLPQKVMHNITIIFNNALNHHYFPSSWKHAKVLPIHKKNKNPHDPSVSPLASAKCTKQS